MKLLKFFPLIIFLIFSVFLYNKIKFKKELEPLSSALVEKKFPNLKIKSLDSNESINNFIDNKFVVINIFASWCAPCRIEHEVLKNFSKEYTIIGIAYKDSIKNIESFLQELGNPYDKVFYDFSGKESINLGLYGVPETFFVNKDSKILYKHVGPINKQEFKKIISGILH
ncbi:MAG: DsbE family thiol:disulfide interchange protein [Pelagibacterales bacterium]|nr:DsbE family thiol:disulfide interchange protein [Pelagibacterales bacterium]